MRVLLIDDHPIVRTACCRLLNMKGGIETAEAATATEGLSIARAFLPEIIVLDLRLRDGSGLGLLATMIAEKPERKIIVFSMYEDPTFAARALDAGARGYITKNDDPDALLQAIDKVAAGGVFLTPAMAEQLALMTAGRDADPLRSLSARERQVLRLLGLGKTLSEIAGELNVSYRTSAHMTAQIKAKLRITSTAALIKWAVDHAQIAASAGC
ncbi:MAG TPA: response regulator transcription factor [Acetobacteraceae bacterium]|nr:response regulator transcription factor [Acetobacteraceae bacterium]